MLKVEVIPIDMRDAGEIEQAVETFARSCFQLFQTMLDNAVRICGAKFGILFLYDGDSFDAAALVGVPQAYAEFLQSGPHRFGDTPSSRAARTRQVVIQTSPGFVRPSTSRSSRRAISSARS